MKTLQIHLRATWKEGFALGNSSCLKIQGFERNLSYHFLLLIIINFLKLGQLLTANLLYLLVAFLSKGSACSAKMTGFLAAEAVFLFNATFAFFWGKLGDFDGIDDHGVGVVGLGVGGVREGVIGLVRGLRVSFGDVIGLLPLGLESDGLLVPFFDGRGDGVHGHDSVHERWWDSCREVSDQEICVGDVGEGYVVLES